jgi:hypothetical protein
LLLMGMSCAQRGPVAQAEPACVVATLPQRSLVLPSGERIYVEPQSAVANPTRMIVAGTPSYVWKKAAAGFDLVADSVIAAITDTAGNAIAVRSHLAPGRAHDVRALALPDGRWALLFHEGPPPPRMGDEVDVRALWFGIVSGSRWDVLEKIPIGDARPRSMFTSELVLTARQHVAFAAPVKDAGRSLIRVFERDGGRWLASDVPAAGALYLSLAAVGDTLKLAAIYGGPSGVRNPMWIHWSVAGGAWSSAAGLVVDPREPVYWPHLVAASSTPRVVWMNGVGQGAAARVGYFVAPDSIASFGFASDVFQVFDAGDFGRRMLLLTHHQAGPGTIAALRMWSAEPRHAPDLLFEFPSAFAGPAGVARIGETILAVGPLRGVGDEPVVRSVLERMVVRCGRH